MLEIEDLKSIIMLSDLNDSMLKKMLKATKKTNYSSGEYIFKEVLVRKESLFVV